MDQEFKVVSRKSKNKRQVEEMETEGEVNIEKILDAEMEKVSKPKMPQFKSAGDANAVNQGEMRRVVVPAHRYTPLKENWMKIFTPVVEHLKLQIRFNTRTRTVELKNSKNTEDMSYLQKGEDFVKAFILGFDVDDSLALLRLDQLFLESFEIEDVKPLHGDHLSRAIGRIAGKGGRTKFTIENVTKTRIVLADNKVHILGSFNNIRAARTAICNLIMGSPPSKVYGNLRLLASRLNDAF